MEEIIVTKKTVVDISMTESSACHIMMFLEKFNNQDFDTYQVDAETKEVVVELRDSLIAMGLNV